MIIVYVLGNFKIITFMNFLIQILIVNAKKSDGTYIYLHDQNDIDTFKSLFQSGMKPGVNGIGKFFLKPKHKEIGNLQGQVLQQFGVSTNPLNGCFYCPAMDGSAPSQVCPPYNCIQVRNGPQTFVQPPTLQPVPPVKPTVSVHQQVGQQLGSQYLPPGQYCLPTTTPNPFIQNGNVSQVIQTGSSNQQTTTPQGLTYPPPPPIIKCKPIDKTTNKPTDKPLPTSNNTCEKDADKLLGDILTPRIEPGKSGVKRIATVTVSKGCEKSPLDTLKELDPEISKKIKEILDYNGVANPWKVVDDLMSTKKHQMPDWKTMYKNVKDHLRVFESLKEIISGEFLDIETYINRAKQYLREYTEELKRHLSSMLVLQKKMEAAKDYGTKDEYMRKFNATHAKSEETMAEYKKLRSWLIGVISAFSNLFSPFNINACTT